MENQFLLNPVKTGKKLSDNVILTQLFLDLCQNSTSFFWQVEKLKFMMLIKVNFSQDTDETKNIASVQAKQFKKQTVKIDSCSLQIIGEW